MDTTSTTTLTLEMMERAFTKAAKEGRQPWREWYHPTALPIILRYINDDVAPLPSP